MLSPVLIPGRARPLATAILNVGSGAQRQAEAAEVLRRLCAEYGDVAIHVATRPQQIYAHAREAVAGGRALVLAGGGDGTISAIASVVAGSDCALGVLPLGTFNYFARRLGIPQELEPALRVCFEGVPRVTPLGEVNGRVFLNNASIGLYPTMLKVREQTYRRWGRSQLAAYLSGLYSLMRTRRHYHVDMEFEGERHEFRTPLLFVSNNPLQVESFGVPGSHCLHAGELAFYVIPPIGRAGLVALGWNMMLRRLDPGRDFSLVCASQARVDARREFLRVAYDGEIEVMRSPLFFRMRPEALKVMAPRQGDSGTAPA